MDTFIEVTRIGGQAGHFDHSNFVDCFNVDIGNEIPWSPSDHSGNTSYETTPSSSSQSSIMNKSLVSPITSRISRMFTNLKSRLFGDSHDKKERENQRKRANSALFSQRARLFERGEYSHCQEPQQQTKQRRQVSFATDTSFDSGNSSEEFLSRRRRNEGRSGWSAGNWTERQDRFRFVGEPGEDRLSSPEFMIRRKVHDAKMVEASADVIAALEELRSRL